MKKYLISLFFAASLLMFFAPDSNAQCAMCKRIAQTDKQNKTADKGRSLNNGILYLLSIPYVLGAAGAVAFGIGTGKKQANNFLRFGFINLKEKQFSMNRLRNIYDSKTLTERLQQESFQRITLSFYRYVKIEDPSALRDELFKAFSELGVLGRIYLATEGINAQINVPENNFGAFQDYLNHHEKFSGVALKTAVEDNRFSFIKLKIKVRNKILADGLNDDTFDVTKTGKHLSAEEFNIAMQNPETIVVDMRNNYESEVGYLKGAVLPNEETFKETLPKVVEMLSEKRNNKILLYCTGGIRCEKASAYLKHVGFTDVNQLDGGIIQYTHQVRQQNLETRFIGKNFVFDDRLGERITEDIISHCHRCGKNSDTHRNCANIQCHELFIQCEACFTEMHGCHSDECKTVLEAVLAI